MTQELFICMCGNPEHQIIFEYDDICDEKLIFVYVHLVPEKRFFKRLWKAIRYVFGYRCRYGEFDEFIFDPKDADKLIKIAEYLKGINNNGG